MLKRMGQRVLPPTDCLRTAVAHRSAPIGIGACARYSHWYSHRSKYSHGTAIVRANGGQSVGHSTVATSRPRQCGVLDGTVLSWTVESVGTVLHCDGQTCAVLGTTRGITKHVSVPHCPSIDLTYQCAPAHCCCSYSMVCKCANAYAVLCHTAITVERSSAMPCHATARIL